MMKVKFFMNSDIATLEAEINGWMVKEGIGPADIFKVCQTEDGTAWTVSVWYLAIKSVQTQY